MLAVIELGGNQFTVKTGDIIDVKKLSNNVGDKICVQAMMIASEDGSDVRIGTPFLSNSKVELKVLEQFKGEKIRVFKMKAKKRYARNKGFRPSLTKLEVLSIA